MNQVSFDISSERRDGGVVVITIAGELELRAGADLKSRLSDAVDSGARTIVVDMSAVTFIDSTGLGALVGGLKRVRAVDGELALVCVDRSIVRIFEITGLDRVFPLHETLADALSHVQLPVAAS